MRTAFALLTLASVALSGGCGTVRNFASDNPRPYGGVEKDVEYLQSSASFNANGNPIKAAFAVGLIAAGLSLSGLADTLTWPLMASLESQKREQETAVLDDPNVNVQCSCGAVATDRPPASIDPPLPSLDASSGIEWPGLE